MANKLFALFAVIALAMIANAQSFAPEYFPFNTRPPAVQVDLNGDGIPDFIAQANNFQEIELLSSGGGAFTAQSFYITGSAHPIASGDFNHDGKADVVFFQPLEIGYGDGAGGFSSVQPISWSNANHVFQYAAAQVADFNGDSKPDLAIAFDTIDEPNGGSTFQVAVFTNNGNGFNDGVTIFDRQLPSGSYPGFEYTTDLDLVLGDFDADGHADLVLRTTENDPINPGTPDIMVTIFYGNGNGGFSPSTVATTNDRFEIAAADMNNDGISDIVANFNPIAIFYGHPNRSFTRTDLATVEDYYGITAMLADVNGDGRKDIVYPSSSPANTDNIGIRTLLQTSSGTFRNLAFEGIDTYYGGHGQVPFSQTSVGDYNRDGKPDVTLFSDEEIQHPWSADVLLNTRTRPNGSCQTPAPVGIHVCSPVANSTVQNPVNFAFSATSFYPVRKMEVWIDGKKRSEKYEVFANEGFANVKLTLAPGTRRVGLFSGGFDGTVQRTSYNITVQ